MIRAVPAGMLVPVMSLSTLSIESNMNLDMDRPTTYESVFLFLGISRLYSVQPVRDIAYSLDEIVEFYYC